MGSDYQSYARRLDAIRPQPKTQWFCEACQIWVEKDQACPQCGGKG